MIKSMRKVKESVSQEQILHDKLVLEAETDIIEGRVYTTAEAHEIIDNWKL